MLLRNTQAGWTALHLAADSGNTECVQLLLERGADFNAKMKVAQTFQFNCFVHECSKGITTVCYPCPFLLFHFFFVS